VTPRHRAIASIATVSLLCLPPARLAAQPASGCENGAPLSTRVAVGSSAVAGNVALLAYFRNAWWAGERAEGFWVNHDWGMEFRDQDKLGHVLGGYHPTRIGTALLRASCVSPGRAVLLGATYATLFQLQIEVWDGYQAKYGFSPPDLLANAAGAGLAVAQRLHPALRHVSPTFSYAPSEAYRRRASNGAELRSSVDYSGQTYWLSVDVDSLLPAEARRFWPDLLRLSVGHSITEWVDAETGSTQRARRRLVLTLDLDPAKLPGDHPLWNVVKRELRYFHLPAPALQLAPTARGIALY
jgi:hypothetical protein